VIPRRITTFRIDEELLNNLREICERDGIPVSEQVRRAIRAWVESKGITKKAERKRAVTRRRS
jgi:antitoxin component of RelBE/YafQ-DinJ toxin-antitoxin module